MNYAEELTSIENTQNLQYEQNVFATFKAETSANEKQFKQIHKAGQILIEKNIEEPRVRDSLESLSLMWQDLNSASDRKQELLRHKILMERVSRDLGSLNGWLSTAELSFKSDSIGKDMKNVVASQKKHDELVSDLRNKKILIRNLVNITEEEANKNFNVDEISRQCSDVSERYGLQCSLLRALDNCQRI